MTENRTQSILLKCMFTIAALIVVMQVLGQSDLASLFFKMTFLLTTVLWVQSIKKVLHIEDLLILLISALALINVLINVSVTGTSLSSSYFNKLIMFVMSLMFLQTASRVTPGQDTVRFILRIFDVLSVFLIVMLIMAGSQMFLINGMITKYLTFRFSNPNMAALFLACMFVVELSEVFGEKSIWSRLIHILLSVVLGLFIVLTKSRNALIALVIFTAVAFWIIWKKPKKMTIGKAVAAVSSVFPLLFGLIYMVFISNPKIQKLFLFLVEEGKELDSRVVVWRNAWDFIRQSPIIGAYSQSTNGTGWGQYHNTHIDITVSYGIVVLILVCIFLYIIIYSNGKRYDDKETYMYMLGFICVMFLGIGEAALFSGGLGIYIFMGVLLLLSKQRYELNSTERLQNE